MRTTLSRFLLLAAVALWLPTVSVAADKALKLDKVHSKIGFTASTLLFDVDGTFKKFDVSVDGDPAVPSKAKVKVTIDVASIDTDNGKRDEHLRAPDFFDASKHPKIVFVSDKVTIAGNKLTVAGKLTMHGKTARVAIPFKRVTGKNGAGIMTTAYKGKLTINRNAWGIGAGSVAAKISLDDEVELDLLIVTFQ